MNSEKEYSKRLIDNDTIYYSRYKGCNEWSFCSESEYQNKMEKENIIGRIELKVKDYSTKYDSLKHTKNEYQYGQSDKGNWYAVAQNISPKYIIIKNFLMDCLSILGYDNAHYFKSKSGSLYIHPQGIGTSSPLFRISDHNQSEIMYKYNPSFFYDIRNYNDSVESIYNFISDYGKRDDYEQKLNTEKKHQEEKDSQYRFWNDNLKNNMFQPYSTNLSVVESDDNTIKNWAIRNAVDFYYVNNEPIEKKQIKGGINKYLYRIEYLKKYEYGHNYHFYKPSDEFLNVVTEFISFESKKYSIGGDIEMEHANTINKFKKEDISTRQVAEMIAKDHTDEIPDYYERLKKMESEAMIIPSFNSKYPKNKWIKLNELDLGNYYAEIFELIKQSYARVGGHLEFMKPNDVKNTELDFWIANDFDEDPNIDIVIAGKSTNFGKKLTTIAQDGNNLSKSKLVKKIKNSLLSKGFYAEIDPELSEKLNLKPIKNKHLVMEILGKNDLIFMSNGTYLRSIKGQIKKKVLVGNPIK